MAGEYKPHKVERTPTCMDVKYRASADDAKKEYAEIYKRLVDKLSVAHLQPFANIIAEHEKCKLQNEEQLVESLKQKMLKEMQRMDDFFWTNFKVADGLMSLEMLKDKFKEHEGTDWKIQEKTPNERTLPQRIRLKKMQIRTLEKNLQYQNAQLEELLAENAAHRTSINTALNQRTMAKVAMSRCKESVQNAKAKWENMQDTLLATDEVVNPLTIKSEHGPMEK